MSRHGAHAISVVQTVASLASRYGGVSRAVPELSDALCELGCSVSVMCMQDAIRSPDIVSPTLAKLFTLGARNVGPRRWWSPAFARRIAQGFAPSSMRLLHDNGLWANTNYAAARYAGRERIPLVISPHGMLEPWALTAKRFRKRLALALFQRKVLESAALLMVTADSEYESVRRAGLSRPVAIVPLGVSLPATLARHDANADVRTFVFLSRIHPKKGLLALIEAWHRTRKPGWRFIIAGPDEDGHLSQVTKSIAHFGLQDQFEVRPVVEGEAKRELFESADVFVLPTFSENFGVVVAEAMSYGIPVLTTRGAPWSVLERIGAGWWVEPGVDGLAAGLRRVLETTVQERARMGQAGRSYAAQHLGWDLAARMTREAYRWILGLSPEAPAHVRMD